MHRNISRLFFGFFLLLFLGSCSAKKSIPPTDDTKTGNETCQQEGKVLMIGLAGCQFLIQSDKGERLLPVKMVDPNYEFKANQRIRFDYKDLGNPPSNCMAEDRSVEITCIENIKE